MQITLIQDFKKYNIFREFSLIQGESECQFLIGREDELGMEEGI